MVDAPTKFVSQGKASKGLAPRQRLVDEAYQAIKTMIITNELTSGQVVSVAALADHLGVSRSPVTKAVTQLEQDGFIESEPYKAPRVAVLSARFVRNVYDLRTVLEAHAASAAVEALTDDEIAELTSAFNSLTRDHKAGDPEAVQEFDTYLHQLFAERADNNLLSGFLDNLDLHLVRIRNVYEKHVYSQAEKDLQFTELSAIAQAAIGRDAAAAESAMKDHVTQHALRLVAMIKENQRT